MTEDGGAAAPAPISVPPGASARDGGAHNPRADGTNRPTPVGEEEEVRA
jgi:hypothetical protein